jgi:putative nucleotidyltransferase with HDIG domain
MVALGAAVLFALSADLVSDNDRGLRAADIFLAGFFCVLMVLASASPVRLPRGGLVTVAFAVDFAALLIAGPALTAWAAALSWIILLHKHPFYAVANAAQTVVVLAAAGAAYESAGGRYIFISEPSGGVPFGPGALLAAGAAYVFVNSLSASAFVALRQRRPLFGIWQVNFGWLTPQFVALAPFGVLMALVYRVDELQLVIPGSEVTIPAGVALFLVPLLWARFSFQGYTQMRQVHLDTIDALAGALEGHDEYHGHHADEVGRLTEMVARELRFPESRMEALRLAARMHDIGKCAADMEPILKKGRDLTEEDWANIRKHPEIGAKIIRQMEVIPGVAEIVRSSHERPDGKGYPDGLAAEEIDVAAMIVAAVDAYHAMTSDRSYRKAMPAEEAIAEMRRHAGSQFDTNVVEAMAQLLSRGELGDETHGRPQHYDEPSA